MKLVSLTVENFRSILAARKIPISQMTTLIGPNNEGKSNILRALAIGMTALVHGQSQVFQARRTTIRSRRRRRNIHVYNWDYDYPLKLQAAKSKKSSIITLEFELTPFEISEFEVSIGSRLNGTLPISFAFHREGLKVSIAKQGRGQQVLNSKSDQIAEFVAKRVAIQYIPAVRTAAAALTIVDELVSQELAKVEDDPRYVQALADISDLQRPILENLSRGIEETMKSFLPQIAGVKLEIEEEARSVALRDVTEILVDDGVATILDYKGDGVQSLAAIALMRHASHATDGKKEIIIALEEPESHLHPRAIRDLRDILQNLAKQHQVVITTHNALFADRINVESNIIVKDNRAYPAKSIADVRAVLGVRLDDNLSSAEVVVLVEGVEDKIALLSMLGDREPKLDRALRSGRLSLDVLDGAGNLSHRARMHTEALCKVHALLDDDSAGRTSYEKAFDQAVLVPGDVNFTHCGGKREAEFEDLYAEHVYESILQQEAGIMLPRQGPDKDKKWSDRVRNLLRSVGRPNDDATMMAIKIKVAKSASDLGWRAVHSSKSGPLESLINSLLQKLALT